MTTDHQCDGEHSWCDDCERRELARQYLAEQVCEVCRAEPVVGVASVPGVPYSAAYGRSCLAANAHPYEIVVANTAMIGGYAQAASWWQQVVDDTLAHLDKNRDAFDAQVKVEVAAFEQWEREDRAKWEAEQAQGVQHPAPEPF